MWSIMLEPASIFLNTLMKIGMMRGIGDGGGSKECHGMKFGKRENPEKIKKKSLIIRVFCPKAGLSLQTQAPRLQFLLIINLCFRARQHLRHLRP